jgi:PHD/YefM family antitoxin component YafN of YafNO toxin-antitoxin module
MIAISEAPVNLAALIDGIESEPLAIQRDGLQIAYIVSPEEYAMTLEAKRVAALASVDACHAEIASRISRGEYTQAELDAVVESLDRDAA